jgi:hypothetical protein
MRHAVSWSRVNLIEFTGEDARACIGLCCLFFLERRVLWFADRM